MPEIMGQTDRLGQVLVQTQGAGNGAANLGDLDGMGQAGAEHIALVIDEHLGLVFKPAKRGRVYDPIPIPLILIAVSHLVFGMCAASGVMRMGRINRETPRHYPFLSGRKRLMVWQRAASL